MDFEPKGSAAAVTGGTVGMARAILQGMNPTRRMGRPQEIADVAVFLTSPGAIVSAVPSLGVNAALPKGAQRT